jgi:hypothetical protein
VVACAPVMTRNWVVTDNIENKTYVDWNLCSIERFKRFKNHNVTTVMRPQFKTMLDPISLTCDLF